VDNSYSEGAIFLKICRDFPFTTAKNQNKIQQKAKMKYPKTKKSWGICPFVTHEKTEAIDFRFPVLFF